MRRARSGWSRGATPFRKDFGGMREPRSMAPEEEEEKARLYSGARIPTMHSRWSITSIPQIINSTGITTMQSSNSV